MTEHEKRLEREAAAFRQQMEARRQSTEAEQRQLTDRRPKWQGDPLPGRPNLRTETTTK